MECLNTLPFAPEHDDIATSGADPASMYPSVNVNQSNRTPVIPGMAPEDRVPGADDHHKLPPHLQGFNFGTNIPGLDRVQMDETSKKVPMFFTQPREDQRGVSGVGRVFVEPFKSKSILFISNIQKLRFLDISENDL